MRVGGKAPSRPDPLQVPLNAHQRKLLPPQSADDSGRLRVPFPTFHVQPPTWWNTPRGLLSPTISASIGCETCCNRLRIPLSPLQKFPLPVYF